MSLPPIITGLLGALGSGGQAQTFSLTPSPTLRDGLKVTDVITGSVQSNLGNGKYSVQFFGEKYIVESPTPLKADEILHGRVVGIGDKVELQRVFQEKAAADKQGIKQANLQHLYDHGKAGLRAAEVLQNYRVALSADEQLALISVLKGSGESEAVTLSAVVLNKMGLPISTSSLSTLYPVLSTTLQQKFNLQDITAHIDFKAGSGSGAAATSSETIAGLSAFIASVVNELPEAQLKNKPSTETNESDLNDANHDLISGQDDLNSENGNQGQTSDDLLFDTRRLLLNAQSDGAVSHRVAVVPFMVNDKLIEVDVALFSQRHQFNENSIKYKKIVLSLNLDMLGKIDIEIALANKHARVRMNTEKNIITDEMVKYMPQLKNDLQSHQIKIDELSYETSAADNLGKVIGSVVDHYVTQDSLSRVY